MRNFHWRCLWVMQILPAQKLHSPAALWHRKLNHLNWNHGAEEDWECNGNALILPSRTARKRRRKHSARHRWESQVSTEDKERDLHLVPKGDGSIVHRWEGKQWLEKVILVQSLLLMIFALTVKSPPFPPPPQETAVNGLSWTLWWVFRHNFSQMSNNFDPLHFRLLKQ